MESNNRSGLDELVSAGRKAGTAARIARAASKGAAAGGPLGAALGAAVEGREYVGKALAAAGALILLPVLFILMLPSLIFGGLADSKAPGAVAPVLNDGMAVTENMTNIAYAVNQILGEGIDDVKGRIAAHFVSTDGDHYEIVNPYETDITSNANMLIAEYCASKSAEWESIAVADLEKTLRDGKAHLYTYTFTSETRVVEDDDPETEDVVETKEELWYIYTISYNGEQYFADAVFHLSDDQKTLADDYAQNLSLFLGDGLFQGLFSDEAVSGIPSLGSVTFYCTIAIDASGYERGIEDATKSSKGLSDTFKASGAAAETLQNKIAVLAAQHAKAQAEVDRLTAAFNKSAAETGVDSKETQALAVQLKNAEKNVSSIQSELDGLTNSTKQSGDEFERTGEKVFTFADKLKSGLATAAKVGAAAVAAVTTATAAFTAATIRATSEAAAYGDHIDKQAQKMNMSAEAYQEWDAIMQHSGTTIDAMQASMKTLANAVENDSDAFERLGITQEQIATMNNEELFSATIAALQNVENETERTYLAGQLLGRGATELGALLNTSAEETEAMRQRVHELNGVMSNEAVKAAAAYQDSLQDMQTAFSGLSRGLVSEFLPGMTVVMDGITRLITGEDYAGEMLESGFGFIADALKNAIARLEEISQTIIPTIANAVIGLLPVLTDLAIDIIEMLANAVVENLPVLVEAAENIIPRIADAILNLLPKLAESAVEIISSIAGGIAESLPELIPTIVEVVLQIVETLIDNVDMLLDAAIEITLALADGLIDSLPVLLEKAPEIIIKFVDALIRNVPKIITAANELIVEFAAGIINNIPTVINAATKIKDKIKEILANLPAMAREWGVDMLNSFIGGITSKLSGLKDTVKGVAQTVKDFIGFSEPKEGPLSNFHTFPLDMMDLFISGIASKESELVDELTTIGAIVADTFRQILAPLDLQSDISSLEYEIWEKQYDASNTALKEATAELENAKALLESVKGTYKDSEDEESAGLIAAAEETVSALQAQYDALKDQSEIEKYAKKQEMLTAQMENQTDVISAAEAAYQTILEQYGENSEESLRYQKTLLQEQLELEKLRESLSSVADMREKLYRSNYDFGTTTVDFASSGVGVATAGLVNGMVSAASQSDAKSYTFNMVMPDGTKFASYVFDPMVDYARANGTPIVNPA